MYAALQTQAVIMHILREADICVSHVGRNTLMEGISQGVPIIALPVTGDQYDNAEVVVKEGLGQAFGLGDSSCDLAWKNTVSNGSWHVAPPKDIKVSFVHAMRKAVLGVFGNTVLQKAVREKKSLAAGLGFDVARDIIVGNVDAEKYKPSRSPSLGPYGGS